MPVAVTADAGERRLDVAARDAAAHEHVARAGRRGARGAPGARAAAIPSSGGAGAQVIGSSSSAIRGDDARVADERDDRLARIADEPVGEHRLVLAGLVDAVAVGARDVGGGQDAHEARVGGGNASRSPSANVAAAWGERTARSVSADVSRRSSANGSAPVTLGHAVEPGDPGADRRPGAARRPARSPSSDAGTAGRRRLDRLDDLRVAGAPAEHAAQPVEDLAWVGDGVAGEQGVSGHQHAGRADPALGAAAARGTRPGAAASVPSVAGEALDRGDLAAVRLADAGRGRRTTCSPSSRTVHAPQSPASQPTFVPVSPRSSRRTSTRRRIGSTSSAWPTPLTVKAGIRRRRGHDGASTEATARRTSVQRRLAAVAGRAADVVDRREPGEVSRGRRAPRARRRRARREPPPRAPAAAPGPASRRRRRRARRRPARRGPPRPPRPTRSRSRGTPASRASGTRDRAPRRPAGTSTAGDQLVRPRARSGGCRSRTTPAARCRDAARRGRALDRRVEREQVRQPVGRRRGVDDVARDRPRFWIWRPPTWRAAARSPSNGGGSCVLREVGPGRVAPIRQPPASSREIPRSPSTARDVEDRVARPAGSRRRVEVRAAARPRAAAALGERVERLVESVAGRR